MARAALFISLALHALFLVSLGLPRPAQTSSTPDGPSVSFLMEESEPEFTIAPPEPAELSPPSPAESVVSPPMIVSEAAPLPAAIEAPVAAVAAKPRVDRPRAHTRAGVSGQAKGSPGSASAGNAGSYIAPQFRTRYKPPYPAAARAQRLEGSVTLLVSIDPRGHVTGVRVSQSSGHAVLDRAAAESVKSWQFEPARSSGTAVAAEVEIPVRFKFNRE